MGKSTAGAAEDGYLLRGEKVSERVEKARREEEKESGKERMEHTHLQLKLVVAGKFVGSAACARLLCIAATLALGAAAQGALLPAHFLRVRVFCSGLEAGRKPKQNNAPARLREFSPPPPPRDKGSEGESFSARTRAAQTIARGEGKVEEKFSRRARFFRVLQKSRPHSFFLCGLHSHQRCPPSPRRARHHACRVLRMRCIVYETSCWPGA
jgi:hypothetical protein